MQCSQCGFDNAEGMKFCGQCGSKLEKNCPKCDFVNPPGFKFCGACGCPLEKLSAPAEIDYRRPDSYTPPYLADKIIRTRSHLEGERKLVTILAADVAGYTRISELLDPEAVHAVMDGCFKILMRAVHTYEGTINQFLGDGIMAIFGAPVAHEDHAQRACHAALSIQKALAEYSERLKGQHGIDFAMRIGLNTGQVVVGSIGDDLRMDYMALGDTTNIAFLLEQRAERSQVLISQKVYQHVKGYFDCRKIGETTLKNRREPITYYHLQREGKKRSRLDAEKEQSLTAFVNRKKELAMMLDLFEQVKEKHGQVLCLAGEAGQGKSRLIFEFKKSLDPNQVTYLESQCLSFGKNIAYEPIVELLRKSFTISDSDSPQKICELLTRQMEKLNKRLLNSIPILCKLLSAEPGEMLFERVDPEQAKAMIFEALRLLILSGSQVRPIVIVVENLQWLDHTSEEFLACIIESIANFPVFLVLSYRLDYTFPGHAKSYLRQISLGRLSREKSGELVSAMLPGHRLPTEFIDRIVDKAGGNPLYIEEIIKCLLENRIIMPREKGFGLAKAVKEIDIPETIQEIVLSRVDRLNAYSKTTIQTASVIGREFTLKLLTRKDDLERRLEDCLRELKNLELVSEKQLSPEIEYMFKNAMTKDVIYGSLLLNRRQGLHKKIAAAIENIYQDKTHDVVELLAYHYAQSDDVDKAIDYLLKAGDKARSIYGNQEAVHFFENALELMDQQPGARETVRRKTHKSLAELYDLIGDYRRSIQHYTDCIATAAAPAEAAGYLRKIGMLKEKQGDLKAALAHYEQALEKIDTAEDPLEAGRIYMNIGWIHNRLADYRQAKDFNNRALAIFRQQARDYETALVLNNLAVIHEFCGEFKQAEVCNHESIDLIKRVGDQRKLAAFYLSSGLLNIKKGNREGAREFFQKSQAITEAIGNTMGMASAILNLGHLHLMEGDLDKAQQYLQQSLEMFDHIEARSKRCQAHIALAELNLKQENLKTAQQFCEKAMATALDVPYRYDQAGVHAILGAIALKEGGDALGHFVESARIYESLGRQYELARTLKKLGAVRIQQGEKAAGEKDLQRADEILEGLERG